MKFLCPKCLRRKRLKRDGFVRHHTQRGGDEFCPGSGAWPAVSLADIRDFHIFDGALNHCPDPDDNFGHVVAYVDGSDSLARLAELATEHSCEDNDDA